MIVIDEKKCDQCNLCAIPCPGGLIDKGPKIKEGPDRFCIECGHCVAVCPKGAITLSGKEDVRTGSLPKEKPVDAGSLMSFMKGRISGREYSPGPVAAKDIEKIIEAASTAPSAHNNRSTKAYVCRDKDVIDKIKKRALSFYRLVHLAMRFPLLPPMMRLLGWDTRELEMWIYTLGDVIIGDKSRDRLLYDTETLLVFTISIFHPAAILADAWLAAEHAVLYAESIGVASCYNGFITMHANFDPSVRKALGVPWSEIIMPVLTMGYPRLKYASEAPRKVMPVKWIGGDD